MSIHSAFIIGDLLPSQVPYSEGFHTRLPPNTSVTERVNVRLTTRGPSNSKPGSISDNDAQTGMTFTALKGAMCVQRFEYSLHCAALRWIFMSFHKLLQQQASSQQADPRSHDRLLLHVWRLMTTTSPRLCAFHGASVVWPTWQGPYCRINLQGRATNRTARASPTSCSLS